jgi:small subunit ribosomal protein S17e
MDRIKRLSFEVLDSHKSKFGEDFADNKKALNQIAIIRSKSLKNKVTGYITRFIKKEIREEKDKQARISSSQFQEQEEFQTKTPEITISEKVTSETIPVEEKTESVEEKTESVEEKTESVEEKTESVEEKTE